MFYSRTSTSRMVSDTKHLLQIKVPFSPKKMRIEILCQKKLSRLLSTQQQQMLHIIIWHCDLTCKTICAWSANMQLQLHHHHWHWPPKKITTRKKHCILEIGIGSYPIQHLHIRPYNSYHL